MRIKVLIVDDEKLIREGLIKIIERIDDKYEIIGEAKNGLEALEKIKKLTPDLAIIDIKMPTMDGLELLKKINQENIKIKIIILSGHDEFSYAKTALENGARTYILKPFEKNELLDTLNRLSNEIIEERNIETGIKRVEIIKERLLETEIKNIVLEQVNGSEIQKRLSIFEWFIQDFKENLFTILVKGNTKTYEEEYSFLNLKKQLDNIMKRVSEKAISFYISNDTLFYFINNIDCLDNNVFSSIKLDKIKIAICDKKLNICEIYEGYQKALYTVKYTFLSTGSNIKWFTEVEKRRKDYNISKDMILKLKYLVGTDKFQESYRIIDKLFCSDYIENYSIEYFESTIDLIYKEVIEHLVISLQKKIPELDELRLLGSLYNFDNIYEYKNKLIEILEAINNAYTKLKGIYKTQSELEKAIEYINKNYYKDINMTVVANSVSLNYYYFSTLFKEHTNLSFIDYLNNVRINKAKELLSEGKLKIYEISEKVGFKNPKHFARIFKNITGLTPIEYKEMIELKKNEKN